MSPSQRGFALTEVLVALFVLGVSTVAVTGLAVLGTRTSFESERQTVALALANEEVEHVRSLPYESVGYVDATGNEPDGVLTRRHSVQRNQQTYIVDTTITLVDDPINGTLPEISLNEFSADYKRVTIKVSWQSTSNSSRNVAVTSILGGDRQATSCTPGDPQGCDSRVNPPDGACIPHVACPESGFCPTPQPQPYCPPGAQYCAQCYTDNDCSAGNVCDTEQRTCVPKAGACRTSDDCSGGQVCGENNLCINKCSENSCSDGKVCSPSTGLCVMSCTDNACSCPAATACNTETGFCETPSPTPTPTPTPDCDPELESCDTTPSPTPDCDPYTGICSTGSPTPSATPICDPTLGLCYTPSPIPTPTPTPTGGGGGGGGNPPAPTPTPTPGSGPTPCNSDSQCSSGLSCVNGSCQGSWCQLPNMPSLDCNLLPTYDPDPTCRLTISCAGGGRLATVGWTPVLSGGNDPACNAGNVIACNPKYEWKPCPTCPKTPPQCSDGLDNDGDKDDPLKIGGGIDWNGGIDPQTGKQYPADPGCTSATDTSEFNTTECSDGKDNNPEEDLGKRIDRDDPGCYTDFNVTHNGTNGKPDTYDANRAEGVTQCTDLVDNDNPRDNLVDAADPGCFDTNNNFVAADNDEFNQLPQCTQSTDQDLGSQVNTWVRFGQTTFGYCDTPKQICGANPLPDRFYVWTAPYNGNFQFIVEMRNQDGQLQSNQTMQFYLELASGNPSCRQSSVGNVGTYYVPFFHLNRGDPVLMKVNATMTQNEFFRIGIGGFPDPTPTPTPTPTITPTPTPPPTDMCTSLRNSLNHVSCGDGTSSSPCFSNGEIICPKGAVCDFAGVQSSVNVRCAEHGAVDRYCGYYGTYLPGTIGPDGEINEGPSRRCQEAMRQKFGNDFSQWPPRGVDCSQQALAGCYNKNLCTAQFSEAICGGPNVAILPAECKPVAGSFSISCFNERPQNVPGDGFCDQGESAATSPECPGRLNGLCYYPNSNNGTTASNCPYADRGSVCRLDPVLGNNTGQCILSCNWQWFGNSCPDGYKCDAIPFLNGKCQPA